jgi:hypothetical protein
VDVTEGWLTGYITVSEPLVRALDLSGHGGHNQRVTVFDRLAEHLRLPVASIGGAGYDLLDRLIGPLQQALDEGPEPWIRDGGRSVAGGNPATRSSSSRSSSVARNPVAI